MSISSFILLEVAIIFFLVLKKAFVLVGGVRADDHFVLEWHHRHAEGHSHHPQRCDCQHPNDDASRFLPQLSFNRSVFQM